MIGFGARYLDKLADRVEDSARYVYEREGKNGNEYEQEMQTMFKWELVRTGKLKPDQASKEARQLSPSTPALGKYYREMRFHFDCLLDPQIRQEILFREMERWFIHILMSEEERIERTGEKGSETTELCFAFKTGNTWLERGVDVKEMTQLLRRITHELKKWYIEGIQSWGRD